MTRSSSSAAGAAAWTPEELHPPLLSARVPGCPPTAAELQEEVEAATAEAYAEGLAEGRAQGAAEARREAEAEVREALGVLSSAATAVAEAERGWLEAIPENIAALAVAVARDLVGRELKGDGTFVADLVRRALAEFPVEQAVRVRLNPKDLSVISAATGAGKAVAIGPGRELSWLPDPRVAPGGCVVEGRERIVDGRVDRALERVYRSLSS